VSWTTSEGVKREISAMSEEADSKLSKIPENGEEP
jgi:hypothetical protein|tara:strand:- start:8647 stop:8751 length:105 start_codon:yes stop_codon:yes gene_type:complete